MKNNLAYESLFLVDELPRAEGRVINKGTGKVVYSLPSKNIASNYSNMSDVKASIAMAREAIARSMVERMATVKENNNIVFVKK